MKTRRSVRLQELAGAGMFVSVLGLGLLAFGQSRGTNPLMPAGPPEYDLTWFTIDGGGAMFSTGGVYELSATIGQPDAGGTMEGASESGYELTGGFWFAQVPGDCVFDGAVDLLDHVAFIDCLAGPSTSPAGDDCACFDLHADGDIDLRDFRELQVAYNVHN